MKTFHNLSKNESLEVSNVLIENSKVLLNSAKLLFEQQSYGVATSLTILGGEELVKGAMLYFHSLGIQVLKVTEFKGVFRNHIPKHEAAKISELLKILEGIVRMSEKKFSFQADEGWANVVYNFLSIGVLLLEPIAKIHGNVEWWNNADKLKNRGFYVDYKNELLSPSELNHEDYHRASMMMNDLSNRLRVIRVFVQKLNENDLKKMVKLINDHL